MEMDVDEKTYHNRRREQSPPGDAELGCRDSSSWSASIMQLLVGKFQMKIMTVDKATRT